MNSVLFVCQGEVLFVDVHYIVAKHDPVQVQDTVPGSTRDSNRPPVLSWHTGSPLSGLRNGRIIDLQHEKVRGDIEAKQFSPPSHTNVLIRMEAPRDLPGCCSLGPHRPLNYRQMWINWSPLQ